MKRLFLLFTLYSICIYTSNAIALNYEYLYTISSDGVKSLNGICDDNFNKSDQPFVVIFSEDYSMITFGKEELQPYVWRLAFSHTHNDVFYYENLYVPGLQSGYQITSSHTAGLLGRAAGELLVFEISCNQPTSNVQFSSFKGFPPIQTVYFPKSPITILVKSDLSKINIIFHKSGDTLVLQRITSTKRNNKLPELIE